MSKAIHFLVAAAPLAIGVGYASASPVSITAAGNSEAGSVGVGQGLGTDGYLFFPVSGQTDFTSAFGAEAFVQPAYVGMIGTTGNSNFGGGSSTTGPTITAVTASASSAFQVGEEFQTEGTQSFTTMVTITLNTSVPQEFQLGVLGDTYGNSRYNSYTVSDGTAATATAVNNATDSNIGAPGIDEFYYFDISNASPGDTISIAVLPTTNGDLNPMLSGITFDTIATPEPASLSILAFGAVGLLKRRRRDMKKERKPLL
jgi:PEP-CTERM motif